MSDEALNDETLTQNNSGDLSNDENLQEQINAIKNDLSTFEARLTTLSDELEAAKSSLNDLTTSQDETKEKLEALILECETNFAALNIFNRNKNGELIFSSKEYELLNNDEKNNGKIYLIKD